MNTFEKEPKQEQKSLEDFQQEIRELKDKAIKEKGKMANPNLVKTEADKLTEEDMDTWQTIEELSIDNITEVNLKDFEKYKSRVRAEQDIGRLNFAAFMANRLFGIWGKKELRDFQNKKNK